MAGQNQAEAVRWHLWEGQDFKPGDVIGLDDGTLWRNEGTGWKQLPQIHWPTRMKQQQKRIM
jgi:hypothetical protein